MVADRIPVDWSAARALLPRQAARLATILRTEPELEREVPGLRWDAGEVVAHLVTELESFARFASGDRSPAEDLLDEEQILRPAERVARVNDRLLATVKDRAPDSLARRLEEGVLLFLRSTASSDGGEEFRSWEGTGDVANAGGVLVGELAVHGLDVARAVRRPWDITPEEATVALAAAANLLPDYVHPERSAGTEVILGLSFRGGMRLGIHIHDGAAIVSEGRPSRADCRVAADPVAFLLVSFGRLSPLLAAVRLQVVAYGWKPWLAFTFLRMVDSP